MLDHRASARASGPRRTILHAFSTFEIGGPQVRFARLANAFGPRFRHVLAAMDNRFEARRLVSDAVPIEYLELPIRKGRGIANLRLLRDTITDVAPDVLATYNWGSFEWTLANAWTRVPQVHVEEGFGPEESARRLPRRSLARRVGLRLAPARVVVVSETMRAIALREWGVPEARVVLVPNGVAVGAFGDAAVRGGPSRFSRGGERVVGAVAGLRAEKRLDRLVAAVASLRAKGVDVRAVLVGDGPERAGLEALARASGVSDRVDFLGFVSDPAPLYAEFDLFALTSDTEQMPVALLEAMAAGLPIVASDVGDVRSILGDAADGQVVRPDVAAVALAIAELLGSPDRCRALGRANRAAVERRFSDRRMLASWSSLYAHGALEPVETTAEAKTGAAP